MKRLGKGLDALVGEEKAADEKGYHLLEIDKIEFNPFQPRKASNQKKLKELAKSIEENGIIQPVIVRIKDKNKYELIAGERRITAAELAGLETIPAIIREAENMQMLSLAIIENIQRENLNPVDEATGYERLVNEFDLRHQKIAELVGKSRTAVSNTLRLLHLPDNVLKLIEDGKLSAGHGRAILQVDEDLKDKFAQKLIENNIPVRKAEKLAAEFKQSQKPTRHLRKDPNVRDIENKLSKRLGHKISINGLKKGKLIIKYYSSEELNNLIEKLQKI